MAVNCPMCGSPPNTCNCIQNLRNYLKSRWSGVGGTSRLSSPVIPKYWEHTTPIEVWLNRLKQFPDLPTEYPGDFDLKRDIDFYLEAIHEMGDEEIYRFLQWIATQVDAFYAARSITVLDAFVIREYCNRLILAKNKEIDEKEIESRERLKIYQEDWYKSFPKQLQYRLESVVEHRLEQRCYEAAGDEKSAQIAFDNFQKALAYEKSLASTNFIVDDEIPSEPDMAQGHNKRIRKQILILEELEKRNEIPKKEVRRKIKELEKQYR